jgi:adenylate kinase
MKLVFLGPPGVGKGTQAKRLAGERDLPHIATGDILRAAIRSGSEIGKKAKEIVEAGQLVPDEIVIQIIEDRFKQPDVTKGFLLDGFPRTVAQGKALATMLDRIGSGLDRVLYFDAPDETLVERISGRRSCKKCQANFHVKFLPPKAEGVCDACGGELFQRADDNEKTVRERLRVYRDQTGDLIPFYKDASLLVRIDASDAPDKVYSALQKGLE